MKFRLPALCSKFLYNMAHTHPSPPSWSSLRVTWDTDTQASCQIKQNSQLSGCEYPLSPQEGGERGSRERGRCILSMSRRRSGKHTPGPSSRCQVGKQQVPRARGWKKEPESPPPHLPGVGEPLGKPPGVSLVDEPGYTKPMDTRPGYRPRTAMGSRAWPSECSRLIRSPHPHPIRQVRLEYRLKPSIKLKGTSWPLGLSFQVMVSVARAGAVPAPQTWGPEGN